MSSAIKPLVDVSGMICQIDDEARISHAVCRIRYIENDTGEFKYAFTPNYAEIDLMGEELFDGIQGLDLSRRQKRYTRTNRTPVFISERVPANNREDVRKLFLQEGMEGRSKLEWLINTKTTYSGDRLVVRVLLPEELDNESVFLNVELANEQVSSNAEKEAASSKDKDDSSAQREKLRRPRRGRPSRKIDQSLWDRVFSRYLNGEISAREASGMLEISESTFFRRLRDNNEPQKDGEETHGKAKGRYANRTGEANGNNALGARFEAAQAEIKKLDGAEFQRLCTRYVQNRYRLRNLTTLGMKAGTYNTVQGTPDAFWEYPDGAFLAMEAGHYSSNKASAKKKIVADIQKCVDYEKGHLSEGTIRTIVACYSFSRFTPEDIQEIRDACPARDIELVGPDELATAATEEFPWIGRELLGISYKSHAVMSVPDFIEMHGNSQYRAPLDFALVEREEEMKNARELLENNQVVIIEGESGAGKTRLAIELVEEYGVSADALPIAVKATKEDISEELVLCCKGKGERIVLLDDANEVSRLSFLPGFLLDNPNVKLIATVRNYASDMVKKEFRDVKTDVLQVRRLQEDKLDNALENVLEIASPQTRKVLADQSHGNLRLAYFIQRAYVEGVPEDTSFSDVIKECYGLMTGWLSENEKNAIRISSILGAHRTFDNEDLNMLLECVGMGLQTYKQACVKLCEDELMDSVQDVEAVSFEEQNLRDYFIYEGLVASRIVSFKTIWSLSRGDRLLLNCVNVLLRVFPEDETIDFVKEQLSSIWENARFEQRKDLVKKYHTLLGSKGLRFLMDQAGKMQPLGQDISTYKAILKKNGSSNASWLVAPLSEFAQIPDKQDFVLETITALIENDALSTTDVAWTLTEGLCRIRPYGQAPYDFETKLFDRFMDEYAATGNEALAVCIVLLAKKALRDEVDWTESDDGRTCTFWTATLNADDALVAYRRHVLNALHELCSNRMLRREILEVVFGYSAAPRADSNDLFDATAGMIAELFVEFASCDDLRSLNSAAMFAHHCSFYGANDLAEKLFARIGTSAKARFLFSLVDERQHLGEEVENDSSVEMAKQLNENDWREIFEALSDETEPSGFDSHLQSFMQCYISSEWSQSEIDKLCDLMLSAGCLPYGGNALYGSMLRRWGAEEGRQRILASCGPATSSWLQNFDEYCLVEGRVLSEPNDYIRGWKEHAEVLPLDGMLKVEREHEGFLASYLGMMKEAHCNNPYILRRMLPFDEDVRNALKPYMDDPEVLKAMESLALRYFEGSGWVYEDLAMYLFNCDRAFIADLVRIDARVDRGDALKQLAYEFWRNPTSEELSLIGASIEEASKDYKNYYRCRKYLKLFLIAAFERHKGEEALEWMRSLSCEVGSKHGIWAEIVCSLSDDLKIKCIVSACDKGIEKDVFAHIAFSMSFEGKSWWGSESSVVRKDAESAKKLKEALSEKGLYKYVLDCDDYIEFCEKKLRAIEIEDFINDW